MSAEFLSRMFGLEGQVAVVIGGTGVLGGALCDGLAQAGAAVVVSGNSQERGAARVEVLRALGARAEFVPANATQRESIRGLLDQTLRQFGRVDMLVNCAGVNAAIPYAEIKDEEWHRVIDGNLTATHLGCQVFAPYMEIGRAHV